MNARIEALLDRAEQCHREAALEYFNAFAGLQERLDISPILARYPELHDPETYGFVAALDAPALPDHRLRRFLKLAFAGFRLSDRLKDLHEELANAESSAAVEVDGESIPLRSLPGRMANEADYAQRRRLGDAYLAALAEHNPLREELHRRSAKLVRDMGWPTVVEMQAELLGFRAAELAAQCRRFLDETDAVYADRLARYSAEAGVPRERLGFADMSYVLRGGRFDHLFPPDQMVPALARTLAGLGIDLEAQTNVTLDLEARPRKTPRAFCIGIDAPRDVRLVLSPRGGQDDFAILFHEAGHLEFSAHMDPQLSYLYRQHGDLSVHESYAFLLQHLTSEPAWWREIMHADPGEYPAFARFNRLYMLRRYSAKLNYELEYYAAGGGPQLAERYSYWLSRALQVDNPPERYLADFDEGLYVLQYLQAWIWEAQLRRWLTEQYGETWFTKRAAGELLRELWRDGMQYDAWEVADRLGVGGLDIGVIQAELMA